MKAEADRLRVAVSKFREAAQPGEKLPVVMAEVCNVATAMAVLADEMAKYAAHLPPRAD